MCPFLTDLPPKLPCPSPSATISRLICEQHRREREREIASAMQRPFKLSLLLLLLLALESRVLCLPSESANNEVLALTAFKQAIYEDPRSVMSDWNARDSDPCSWSRVICSSSHGRVVSLNLSGSFLKGFLAPEVGSLSSLQELILTNNLLLGTIPIQIGMLKNLKVLDLSVNRFSGPLHPEIGQLTSIQKINLHSNGLTGTLPPDLGKLTSLVEIHLDRNKFTGSIPASSGTRYALSVHGMPTAPINGTGLCQLPRLEVADFSYNFFLGKVPSCLKYLPRASFQGNCFQDGYSVFQRSSQLCSMSSKGSRGAKEMHKNPDGRPAHQNPHQPEWLLILEITTGLLVFVFLITVITTAVRKCKPKPCISIPWKKPENWKDYVPISIDGEMLKNVTKLSRQDLEVACEDFSNIIDSSSDSVVYKGTMKDGPAISVISICISQDQWTSYLEIYFQAQVADLARLNHENMAKLLGYCTESDPFSRMLVFEYASNGTLYEHLHYGDGYQFSWFRRMKIAIGVARGLRYLHTELQPPFTIYDLNSSAVYLTEDFFPKLVDFESWKMICSRSEKNSGYFTSEGSFHGFMGSLEQRHSDVQDNTFSFGVLLLEIISGRPPYCKDRGCLVSWAMDYLQHPEEIGKLVDPQLKDAKADDLAVICSVVSLCLEPDPSKRPSMQIICAVLENGIDLSPAALLKESPLSWAELALST